MSEEEYTPLSSGQDDVETIVGPSVKVEGDFVSKGNVVIEGMVSGSVKTDKNLRVEEGACINANVKAENVRVAGEVKGNVQVKGLLELTESARVLGDVQTKTLVVAAGATLHGNCVMDEERAAKTPKRGRAKIEVEEDAEVEFEEERELELA
ncbi:MAG: hypothetical protein CMI52_01175 [Parcubacteria group bacterium]|nr:hypothetical protein [Parcubacteria group bacterium]